MVGIERVGVGEAVAIGVVETRGAVGVVAELGEEAGGHIVTTGAEGKAGLSVGENEALASASHADVGETAFLFEIGFVVEAAGAWEETFFHTNDEDDREFKAFGGMHGHKGNGIMTGGLVGAGHKGGIGEEIGE